MRDLIMIGELAKLMNVSSHQVRYFEEKGILMPYKIDENGYRLYSLDEVYKLAHILLLRDFGISVSEIRNCFEKYDKSDYLNLLKDNLIKIENEMDRLIKLRKYTEDTIKSIENVNVNQDGYEIKKFSRKNLRFVYSMTYDENFSLKTYCDKRTAIHNLYCTDTIMLYDDDHISLYVEDNQNSDAYDLSLDAGDYLYTRFSIDCDNGIEKEIEQFIKFAISNNIQISDFIIIEENSLLSMCYNKGICYEIKSLII